MMNRTTHLSSLEVSILRTLLYADVFQFPLTQDELYRYLIHDAPVSRAEFNQALQSADLQKLLCELDGYITFHATQHHIDRRCDREALTQALLPVAIRYGRWLAALPFVRGVVLTGALAARNPAHAHDDFDYMLIVTPGRVWLARAFSIVLVRLMRRRGVSLCPNYVLAESDLEQKRQDLYVARELAQMQPLFGEIGSFYTANLWARAYLPHLTTSTSADPLPRPRWKRFAEWLLSNRIGDALERWEYQRKAKRFQRQIRHAESVQIDDQHVKGHFQDHGAPILQQYEARLAQYGLLVDTGPALTTTPDAP